jgi:hypothetical protein
MFIRYSKDPKYPEVAIELLDQDFEEIQSKLLEDNAEVFCQETSKSPLPYSRYLSSIKVHVVAEQLTHLLTPVVAHQEQYAS